MSLDFKDKIMTIYQAPLQDMFFILNDVLNSESNWIASGFPKDKTEPSLITSILNEASRIAQQALAPINHLGDEQGATWSDGSVKVPHSFKSAYQLLGTGGWVGLTGHEDYGGMGMPKTLSVLIEEMFFSANTALSMYAILSSGAAHLIELHATDEVKSYYLPKLYSGEWAATMCLTEAHAGSDLGLLKTKAIADPSGTYHISGEKIFITGGDHNLTDNIIHLVLARLDTSPEGIQGISLFLVPKLLEKNNQLVNNQVACASIENKMGIKASSTCIMLFDQAEGYLIGKPNEGLKVMFSMMNHERLSIALQGLGLGVISYQTALSYSKTRLQGKHKKINHQPVPIVEHGDVKRMLLTMKALNEAGRALVCYAALTLDQSTHQQSQVQLDKASLLTPIIKAFLTDMGFDSTVLGQQILGGHGYIVEWGQEQHVRDARIAQIYEGTNGIQSLDLLSRKVIANKGKSMFAWLEEMKSYAKTGTHPSIQMLIKQWISGVNQLEQLTQDSLGPVTEDWISGNACTYLHATGYVAYGYMWIKIAQTAAINLEKNESNDLDFLKDKLNTAHFYFQYIWPRVDGLFNILKHASDQPLMDYQQT